jgi:DNA-damage-inducible protein D
MLVPFGFFDGSFFDDVLEKAMADRCVYFASDLMASLDYDDRDRFEEAVHKAMQSCATLNIPVRYHFRIVFVSHRNGLYGDYRLSSFACYLITMNADPGYPAVARAQHILATGKEI